MQLKLCALAHWIAQGWGRELAVPLVKLEDTEQSSNDIVTHWGLAAAIVPCKSLLSIRGISIVMWSINICYYMASSVILILVSGVDMGVFILKKSSLIKCSLRIWS